jgi:hypothetical protein
VGIKTDCQAELSAMRGTLSDLSQQQALVQEQSVSESHDSSKKLNAMQGEVNATRQLCEQIGNKMSAWLTEERNAASEERDSFRRDVICHLIERVEDLRQIVHGAGLTCSSNFDSFSNALAVNGDDIKLAIQQMADNFQSSMGQTLELHRGRAESNSTETQRALTGIEGQINTLTERLKDGEGKVSGQDTSSELTGQGEEVLSLRNQVLQLEKDALKTTDLQKRWHSDIQLVDSIKSDLKVIQHMPSQGKRYNKQLAEFAEFSSLLDSTLSYLIEQETWVKQQLGFGSHEINANTFTPLRNEGQRQSSQITESNERKQTSATHDSEIVASPQSAETSVTKDSSSDSALRRVQVQSPTEISSLSLPPSIEQEQRRRRVPGVVRPILKSNSLSSSQESNTGQLRSGTIEIETELGPVQENRNSVATVSSASMASQKIREEVSSGFIVDHLGKDLLNLPRIQDWPSFNADSSQQIRHKRKLEGEDRDGPRLKGLKLSSNLSNYGPPVIERIGGERAAARQSQPLTN